MKFILVLFILFICTREYVSTKNKGIYFYKTDDCVGMSVPEDIYMGNRKVGIVKTIKSYRSYCVGQLKIDSVFKVSCKMKFYKVNNPFGIQTIKIELDSLFECKGQVSSKDTIVLLPKP